MIVAASLVAVGLAATGCSSGGSTALGGGGSTAQAAASGSAGLAVAGDPAEPKVSGSSVPQWMKGATGIAPRVGDVNQVAQAVVPSVKVFASVKDTTPWKTLASPLPSKAPLVFLVQERAGEWLRVMVPVRPNQSQGWIKASDVKVSQVDYRISISVGEHALTVYQAGKPVLTEKVGLGTATTPTPGGVYFIKELIKPADPNGAYGPFAYGLSGFSNVLNEFAGGDGEIGIHGTNDPAGIGKSVSHGCIRMSNDAITKLAGMLPLGVPVQIVR